MPPTRAWQPNPAYPSIDIHTTNTPDIDIWPSEVGTKDRDNEEDVDRLDKSNSGRSLVNVESIVSCCCDAMDPIDALSLASNVISLVDFGLKTSQTYIEIYQTGLLAANTDLKYDALSLQSPGASVEASVRGGPARANLSHLGRQLQESTQRCTVAANDLQTAMSKLETIAGGKRNAVGRVVKTLWKKSDIDHLRDRLERERAVLDGYLLIELMSASGLLWNQHRLTRALQRYGRQRETVVRT